MSADQAAMIARWNVRSPERRPLDALPGRPGQAIGLILLAVLFSAGLAAAEPDQTVPVDAAEAVEVTGARTEAQTEARTEDDEPPRELSERERFRQELEEMADSLQSGEEVDREALRERFRNRQVNRSSSWWKGGELADSLALTGQQKERLDQLHEAAQAGQREAGQRQRELQQALNAALAEADVARVTQLMAERADNAAALQRAEDQWLGGVLEVLSTDQLQTLQTGHPRVLRSRASQGRLYRERR